jgi:hypothetical protein
MGRGRGVTEPKKRQARVRPTSGEKTAVKLAMDLSPPESEQLDWLDDLIGGEGAAAVRAVHRGRGRPEGSRNKRTIAFAEELLSKYRSPVEVLTQISNMSIAEMVAAVGCTKLEALQEIRLAALGAAPFLHSKMPLAVDITNRKIINLNIFDMPAADDSPKAENETLSLTATVVEKLIDGNAQSGLEIPRPDLVEVHGVDEAGADHQRADRRR